MAHLKLHFNSTKYATNRCTMHFIIKHKIIILVMRISCYRMSTIVNKSNGYKFESWFCKWLIKARPAVNLAQFHMEITKAKAALIIVIKCSIDCNPFNSGRFTGYRGQNLKKSKVFLLLWNQLSICKPRRFLVTFWKRSLLLIY